MFVCFVSAPVATDTEAGVERRRKRRLSDGPQLHFDDPRTGWLSDDDSLTADEDIQRLRRKIASFRGYVQLLLF